MKILILNGSPHPQGTSALLIQEFTKGAEEKGHTVNVFHTAKEELHPCLGCNHCYNTGKGCVYKDGMETLNSLVADADLLVFSTPVYYFGMSAQLKMAIDRFYANNEAIMNSGKKAILLATCADTNARTMEPLKNNYDAICDYLGFESLGNVLALGVSVRADIEQTDYPEKAYQLGLSV